MSAVIRNFRSGEQEKKSCMHREIGRPVCFGESIYSRHSDDAI